MEHQQYCGDEWGIMTIIVAKFVGMETMIPDTDLINNLSIGGKKDFDNLFRCYYPRLMAYCRLLVDEETACDIVQDVFLYIWENRTRLDYGKSFHAYIFQLGYSRCIDVLRRKQMIDEKFSGTIDTLLKAELNWLMCNKEDIIQELANKDLLTRIDKLICELPQKRQEVFRLSFYNDLTNSEIARALDIPKRTVESHLYLTLKFLREKVSKEEFTFIMALLTLLHR